MNIFATFMKGIEFWFLIGSFFLFFPSLLTPITSEEKSTVISLILSYMENVIFYRWFSIFLFLSLYFSFWQWCIGVYLSLTHKFVNVYLQHVLGHFWFLFYPVCFLLIPIFSSGMWIICYIFKIMLYLPMNLFIFPFNSLFLEMSHFY